jgi:hypothetical protein
MTWRNTPELAKKYIGVAFSMHFFSSLAQQSCPRSTLLPPMKVIKLWPPINMNRTLQGIIGSMYVVHVIPERICYKS